MQIDCDVTLDNFYSYSTSTKKSKVEEKELTLKYNAEEASSSSQVHTKVNSPNIVIEPFSRIILKHESNDKLVL